MTDNKKSSTNEVEEFIEQHTKTKNNVEILEKKEDTHLDIKFNKWGLTFMILFVAVVGYLIISPLAGIPPFQYDDLTHDFIINELLVTLLGISALILLGLGIYFGWMKKQPEEEIIEDEQEIDSKSKPTVKSEQITFVYKKEVEEE